MFWDEDDIEPREKRPVGRPVENPFPSAADEEVFLRCVQDMIDLYFRPVEGAKKDFVFAPHLTMSKTQFWAIVYIYEVYEKKIQKNLKGFLSLVSRHFGDSVLCDRASIHKSISMQTNLFVYTKYTECNSEADKRAQRKYRSMYQYVIRRWTSVEQGTV